MYKHFFDWSKETVASRTDRTTNFMDIMDFMGSMDFVSCYNPAYKVHTVHKTWDLHGFVSKKLRLINNQTSLKTIVINLKS